MLFGHAALYIWTTKNPPAQRSISLIQSQLSICKPSGPISKYLNDRALSLHILPFGNFPTFASCVRADWLAERSSLSGAELAMESGNGSRNNSPRYRYLPTCFCFVTAHYLSGWVCNIPYIHPTYFSHLLKVLSKDYGLWPSITRVPFFSCHTILHFISLIPFLPTPTPTLP